MIDRPKYYCIRIVPVAQVCQDAQMPFVRSTSWNGAASTRTIEGKNRGERDTKLCLQREPGYIGTYSYCRAKSNWQKARDQISLRYAPFRVFIVSSPFCPLSLTSPFSPLLCPCKRHFLAVRSKPIQILYRTNIFSLTERARKIRTRDSPVAYKTLPVVPISISR